MSSALVPTTISEFVRNLDNSLEGNWTPQTIEMAGIGQKDDPYLDDESDFDEEYFTRTYRPLSNLPTPPPSHRDSSASSPRSLLEKDELLESALFGSSIAPISELAEPG
jgi:hypothetical protein